MLTALLLLMAAPAAADVPAVVDAENNWEAAEVKGNTAFLQGFLAEDYVSVSADGKTYDKAHIMAGAIRQAKAAPAAVPGKLGPTSTIAIYGDLAIVRHHGKASLSVDVLQKRDQRWIAVYSQHTTASEG